MGDESALLTQDSLTDDVTGLFCVRQFEVLGASPTD
jgi:hypothetical protein